MKARVFLLLGAFVFLLSACIEGNDSVVEEDTEAVIEPVADPVDPSTVVCDPFSGDDGETARTQGVLAQLYYLLPSQPQYSRLQDYYDFGNPVPEIDLFFNQLYIPTRPFDRGFITQRGDAIVSINGDFLYEWFALRFRGFLQLGPNDPAGDYQLAVLSDDGAVWTLDRNADGTMDFIIDNDNTHPTRMGCSADRVTFQPGQKIPFELGYFQGPRYHISLVALWRPYPTNAALVNDPHCGVQSNTDFFDSTQDPPVPRQKYLDLLARGWKPLAPENYALPGEDETNPCNEPAPTLSGVAASQVLSTSITMTWATDVASTSQVIAREIVSGVVKQTAEDPAMVGAHSQQITGLRANTLYAVKVKSTSISGRSTESGELTVKTAR